MAKETNQETYLHRPDIFLTVCAPEYLMLGGMKLHRTLITSAWMLAVVPCPAGEKPGVAGAGNRGGNVAWRHDSESAKALLKKAHATDSLPSGMVIRVEACLGGAAKSESTNGVSDVMREQWEFSGDQVHRVEFNYKGGKPHYPKLESRAFDTKELCKVILEGKAIEIDSEKGEGPKVGFIGSRYQHGTRMIQVVWRGDTILRLMETNGATLRLYRESNARAFGALYERLAGEARAAFK